MATARLKCNGCGTVRQAQPGVSLVTLRSQLVKTAGWDCVEEQDLDLCGSCRVRARTS